MHLYCYYKALQTPTQNTGFTSLHHSRGAPTALLKTPQSCNNVPTALRLTCVQTPSRGVYFEHAKNKRRHMVF